MWIFGRYLGGGQIEPLDPGYTMEYHGAGASIFDEDGKEVVGCDEYDVFYQRDKIPLLVMAPDLLSALKDLTEVCEAFAGEHPELDQALLKAHGTLRLLAFKQQGR
jgi:hypothetical protein